VCQVGWGLCQPGVRYYSAQVGACKIQCMNASHGQSRLGEQIKERRLGLGLSQSEAARVSGLGRRTWIRLENGTSEAEKYTLTRVEDTLGWARGSAEAVLAGGEPAVVAHRPQLTLPDLGVPTSRSDGPPVTHAELVKMTLELGLPLDQQNEIIAAILRDAARRKAEPPTPSVSSESGQQPGRKSA
jgi:transcriptional regulator with XRE-family HTH domain